jgi:GDP-L-fucose synthase
MKIGITKRWVDLMSNYERILIAGHTGMVGSEFFRHYSSLGTKELAGISSQQADLRDREQCFDAVSTAKPDLIVMAAAKVGGILSNDKYPVDFLADNVLMQTNLLLAAHEFNVKKFLFFGSSCIYPKFAPQPIDEGSLLTGALEPTNEAYAIAKISGVKLVDSLRKQHGRDYISVMSTSLYGPGDNFDEEYSHVIPSLIRKFYNAKHQNSPVVTLFGDGTPLREFLHVKDIVLACELLVEKYSDSGPINVGSGEEVSIRDLATIIAREIQFDGEIHWDTTKPNGTPRKFLNSERIHNMGWRPTIPLEVGLREVVATYSQQRSLRNG